MEGISFNPDENELTGDENLAGYSQVEDFKRATAELAKKTEQTGGSWIREYSLPDGRDLQLRVDTFPEAQKHDQGDLIYQLDVTYPWQNTGSGSQPYQVTEVWGVTTEGEMIYRPVVVRNNPAESRVMVQNFQYPDMNSMIRVQQAEKADREGKAFSSRVPFRSEVREVLGLLGKLS